MVGGEAGLDVLGKDAENFFRAVIFLAVVFSKIVEVSFQCGFCAWGVWGVIVEEEVFLE